MKKIIVFGLVLWFSCGKLTGQTDTTNARELAPVTVEGVTVRNTIETLAPIIGTYIFLGKKTELINLDNLDANITDKTARQLFAKVPGVSVYDMDGAGNQVNISTRGLDPHRGWEFNNRKDGMILNSDMYAYPASHYSIPLESVERIELVRGTGSLQYGSQFGGMLNYISKQGDTTKPLSLQSNTTVGSFNLLSIYNALGGKIGKWKYYTYFSKKTRDGYRKYEHTDYDAEGIMVQYQVNKNITLKASWARSNYLYRIPVPLTDAMFYADPTQATRSRNYFNPAIQVPSLSLSWQLAQRTQLYLSASAIIGDRNSVMFDKPANVKDSISTTTLQYANRQVDIDRFNSYTYELRLLHKYSIGKFANTITSGLQVMDNVLHRTQLGKGTTGSDFDLTLIDPNWGRDMYFKTKNVAIFTENTISVCHNLSVNVGVRIEIGESNMTGAINYYPENKIPVNIKHNFPLLGFSLSYKPVSSIEVYGGFSQAYRPMIFKDIVPSSIYEKVDENIKDADGYNAELGFRGTWSGLRWDITGFLLQYNNRFGTLALTDATGNFYTYRTNIGNSLTKGIEAFIQHHWELSNHCHLTVFTSTAFMDGRYVSGSIKAGNVNVELKGNKIESVPTVITRNGLTFSYRRLSITGLYSYTTDTFADALNTQTPTVTGALGLVPAYGILDLNATLRVSTTLEIKANLNNVSNQQYFTKRPLFYPGPGVWSSDGSNATFSLVFKIDKGS